MPGMQLSGDDDGMDAAVPVDVAEQIRAVSAALDQVVPAKTANNVLVGTWNIRAFDRITPQWRSVRGDSPLRDRSNVLSIAEIVRRFDVVAVQEVRSSAAAFLQMLEFLGPDWGYLLTDVTAGDAGNRERLAFVYDTQRVKPSGLACEIVLASPQAPAPLPADQVLRQFARTPYAVSFARGDTRFTLVTLHVIYGDTAADRVPELRAIAEWLARWAAGKDPWGHNVMALGDFNIDRRDDPLYQAFTSTGLSTPAGLNHVPRSIFDDPDPAAPADRRHFYDQIAWFADGRSRLTMPFINAGMFDFTQNLIPADDRAQLSWRISDHYPLWCEFTVPAL
ncbi:endonuclease/exonuclease/phosphatase family protein [Paractinoplanes rhizophilus]|uniref:Endonuclease/exonuclease/phosphatase family protein n=1 Tax=Paractinoplanes rhizophilus TaxID=1416877 RepID=A0ABW2I5I7_9ACTN